MSDYVNDGVNGQDRCRSGPRAPGFLSMAPEKAAFYLDSLKLERVGKWATVVCHHGNIVGAASACQRLLQLRAPFLQPRGGGLV